MRIPLSNPMIFHQAIAQNDAATIQELRLQGHKPVAVDQNGKSAIDTLAERHDIDDDARDKLYHSLLGSLNPSAPPGYIKPEAFHGSPWGFEILHSGMLKGGVNDPKGGSQSLEGKVFFSDRTRESTDKFETREKLRQNPRIYAKGLGIKVTTVETRSDLYRLAKAFNHAKSRENYPVLTLTFTSNNNLEEAVYKNLISHLSNNGSRLENESPEQVLQNVGIPGHIKFVDSSPLLTREQESTLIANAFQRIENELAGGKLPFLNLLNDGQTIPLVFGFSKINHLKTHTIHKPLINKTSMFNYQSKDHPLTGTANGGKLKEIEVKSMADLATLILACRVQNVALPEDTVIRLNSPPKEKKQYNLKAFYLDGPMVTKFSDMLLRGDGQDISQLNLGQLQALNQELRQKAEDSSFAH
nr:ankyrin repeat domain-containing protein [Pantoea sp. 201603H]